MKRLLILSFLCLSLSGCRWFGKVEREFNYSDAVVRHYSGGKLIGEWQSDGPVNNSEKSDGYYFESGGHTIEVSGDVQIEIGGQLSVQPERAEPPSQPEPQEHRDTLRP